MKEGWFGEDYLVLFTDEEIRLASERYGISAVLPGYQIIGLRGWDDFIVQRPNGEVFTVPTVPCDAGLLRPFHLPLPGFELRSDQRFNGMLKWYVQPVAFGGDPAPGQNLRWITHDEHAELVRWWNSRYRDIRSTGE